MKLWNFDFASKSPYEELYELQLPKTLNENTRVFFDALHGIISILDKEDLWVFQIKRVMVPDPVSLLKANYKHSIELMQESKVNIKNNPQVLSGFVQVFEKTRFLMKLYIVDAEGLKTCEISSYQEVKYHDLYKPIQDPQKIIENLQQIMKDFEKHVCNLINLL